MSLYLSRIRLNPLHAPAVKLANNPEMIHAKLLATLPCRANAKPKDANQPKTADVLFRVDTTDNGPDILIQSAHRPDWSALELAPRSLRAVNSPNANPETKEYEPQFALGQRLAFRLLTRPSYRKSGDFGLKSTGKRKPGPRLDCRDDTERIRWLRRKGERHGFLLESASLTLFSFPAIKSKRQREEKGGSFAAVQFDGVLVVTDPEKLKDAVRTGIGPQKAFGFGLLSLARLRE